MEIIKENITTIILIIVIIFILIGTGIFCWKIVETSEQQAKVETFEEQYKNNNNNNIGSVGNVSNGNASIDNDIFNYIDMSKYYLNTSNGNVAKIYNKMLETLGKQKYIVETTTGSDCIKTTIDFNKRCFLSEYNDCYICWAYTGGFVNKYKYYYSTGKSESNREELWWMNSNDDFVTFVIDVDIADEDKKWEYSYNKDILRNGYSCYEIIANWDDSYTFHGEYIKYDGIEKLYIDMNTYELIEIERTTGYKGKYSTYSSYYEYSDSELEIPKEAQEFLKIY